MLPSILIRLGGVAAMVGGGASVTLGVLTVLVVNYEIPGSIERAIQKGGAYELPVLNMLLFGALAAIVALHALQRQRYGSQVTLAALSAFIGLVMLPVAWLVAGPSFLPPYSDSSCAYRGFIGGYRRPRGLGDGDHECGGVASVVRGGTHSWEPPRCGLGGWGLGSSGTPG